MIAAVRITMVRVRRCLAGAMATPAGCDAAMPPACVGSGSRGSNRLLWSGLRLGWGRRRILICGEAASGELCDWGKALCGNTSGCDFARVVPGLSGSWALAVCCAATEAASPHTHPSKTTFRAAPSIRFFHICMQIPRPQVKDINWRLSDR